MRTQTLKSTIEKDLSNVRSKIEDANRQLKDNFTYAFEWGVAGELYCLLIEERELLRLLKSVVEKPDTVISNLKNSVEQSIANILKGDFTGGSTSTYHNLAHVHKKELSCKSIERNQLYLEWLTDAKIPMPVI